ncbi:phage portal protein [Rhodococcus maanshanensis]|uniref:Phage portal protein, HK97 family n=1 Tax=Rhodococcus maanshanensis TaxID=183556 RepID=A0A1H7NP54_9NOCA|nr:phage portal protein [Rhodococcus maanshanensis]SEL24788.1 phage portal protein, HK97 family [Rhodococcus maanshanensis]
MKLPIKFGGAGGGKLRSVRMDESGFMVASDDGTVMDRTSEQLWAEQPYLRTVVTFLARNVAQLGLQAFKRDAEGSRERLRDHPLAAMLKRPNEDQTGYELLYALVADLALFDVAYLLVEDRAADGAGVKLRNIPNGWVKGTEDSTPFRAGAYLVQMNGAEGEPVKVAAENMLVFHGWNPADTRMGMSPVKALNATLREQIHAQTFREQLWERGGRVGTYLTRPKDAPDWSNEGRTRFKSSWAAAWSGSRGSKAGGTPVLEDGMELKRVGFSAKEEEYVEASKLALTTVAAVYHVNPTMIGVLDNANYSNVREFRRMLYGDTLGPIMAMIEDRLNEFLVPRFADVEGAYVEFNLGEKLQGSFEEQAAVLSAATGVPYMTPNEARAKLNLPAVAGGDELARPLNMATPEQVAAGNNGEEVAADAA